MCTESNSSQASTRSGSGYTWRFRSELHGHSTAQAAPVTIKGIFFCISLCHQHISEIKGNVLTTSKLFFSLETVGRKFRPLKISYYHSFIFLNFFTFLVQECPCSVLLVMLVFKFFFVFFFIFPSQSGDFGSTSQYFSYPCLSCPATELS